MNKKNLCKEHPLCDICDYCVYYNFNGTDMMMEGKLYKGAMYIEEGYCMHSKMKKVRREPESIACKYFVCEICNPKLRR